MEYRFREIEKKWQHYWAENNTYKTEIDTAKPKYYVLDMFPYPSGAGLHVGHPLGYIASDIFSRFKRMKGFNVLHPMGFDSFGLPAEQYAIQTGEHPAISTEKNIERYVEQLKNIGFSYDWSREIRTADPKMYKWTQWIFMQLFNHWYNRTADKAEPIETLVTLLKQHGTAGIDAVCHQDIQIFSAQEWNNLSETEQYEELLKYRLTYLDDAVVNWCPAMGTVLANDEVKDGVSERGGFPVEQKKMKQWMMRITAYSERLLQGLDTIDWPDALKEMQRNWIGKSQGASVKFALEESSMGFYKAIEVFTTRIDTLFGVSFMVIAPEHDLVPQLTSPAQQQAVADYIAAAKRRTERDRMSDVKTVSGVFTGSYCLHPFSGEKIPIWLADYVLAGYGTGCVMAVPSGDQRDWNFATHFDLPIVPILDAQQNIEFAADNTKEGRYINSDFINGMAYQEATAAIITRLEANGMGKGKIQYRLRDAVFGRQRYWGEPIPVFYKEENDKRLPYLIDEKCLPLELPTVDKYLPTETGEPPLKRAENWKYQNKYAYESTTMPGWAGSSYYWFRYMDPQNDDIFASKEAIDYWQDIDLYLGGSEHATGHLVYSRFWNKFLKDMGIAPHEEFAKKLVNQGMIQGRSSFVYRLRESEGEGKTPIFVSEGLLANYETTPLHVDVNIVENDELNLTLFKQWRPDFENAEFMLENKKYICGHGVEKMSKSKYNVVNPDDVIERYGADTLRLYEMFLGPLTDSKPWDTRSITGTVNFLRKVWRLFYDEPTNKTLVIDAAPTPEELKILHKTIRKIEDDIEKLSFNTAISAFMICANELSSLKCHKRAILQDFLFILAPFAPHICEELWQNALGNTDSVTAQNFPVWNESFLTENIFEYPVQINGKVRATIAAAAAATPAEVEAIVLASETIQKWLEGKDPQKIIVVPKRIVNIVL